MIKSISTIFFFIGASAIYAQNNSSLYQNLDIYLIGGAVLLVAIAAVIVMMKLLESVVKSKEVEMPVTDASRVVSQTEETGSTWWKRIYDMTTRTVPVVREREILLDHNYDGIRELDNRLPPWWLAMFYITVIWGVLYFFYYDVSGYGKSSEEAYKEEMAIAQASIAEHLAGQASVVDENTVTALTEASDLSDGKLLYDINCAVCHLPTGGGLVGPNLTDEFWIHGGGIKDIFRTIKYGVPEKGMIAWASQIRPADMQKVASYILSLGGTNPPNAKAPEGEKYVAPVE